MAPRKDNTPSVATFADHEVITPPHELRKAVTHVADPDGDPVARAEAALAQLSTEFADWMHAECERLFLVDDFAKACCWAITGHVSPGH